MRGYSPAVAPVKNEKDAKGVLLILLKMDVFGSSKPQEDSKGLSFF